MAELNGIDPDKKKKIALAIKKMQADGVSDEKISAAVKKFMATDSSTVKKKVDTQVEQKPSSKMGPPEPEDSSQDAGSGSTDQFDSNQSILQAQKSDLGDISVLDAQKLAEQQEKDRPGISMDEYQQIAVEDAQSRVQKKIKSDPQFITQTKTLRDESVELARSEVIKKMDESGLDEESANELFNKRANEIFQERISSDEKIQSLNSKYQEDFMSETQKNMDAYVKMAGAKRKADRLPFMERIAEADGTDLGKSMGEAIVESIEVTLPREFTSFKVKEKSNELAKLRKAIEFNKSPELWDEQRKKLDNSRGKGIGNSVSEDYKGVPEEEILSEIKEGLGITSDLMKKIDEFDVQASSSELNRDLIKASEEGIGPLVDTMGTLFGDQIARLPTMLVGGSFISEMSNIYMDNVNAIAEKEGITPLEVIEQGKDQEGLSTVAGMLSGSLDMLGLGKIVSLLKNATKNTIKKNAVGVLTGAGVEGLTEGGQNLVAQQAKNIATDSNEFDLHALANETLAGTAMGLVFAAPGITRSGARNYNLNGQEITRSKAGELIEAGEIDGLTIENDPVMEGMLANNGKVAPVREKTAEKEADEIVEKAKKFDDDVAFEEKYQRSVARLETEMLSRKR